MEPNAIWIPEPEEDRRKKGKAAQGKENLSNTASCYAIRNIQGNFPTENPPNPRKISPPSLIPTQGIPPQQKSGTRKSIYNETCGWNQRKTDDRRDFPGFLHTNHRGKAREQGVWQELIEPGPVPPKTLNAEWEYF
ncbi:MAG: hypothetical protein IIC13_06230 [SAR324 cluster bacterium]|nr:hypothetical protein [SAR324 cluster bacterium]